MSEIKGPRISPRWFQGAGRLFDRVFPPPTDPGARWLFDERLIGIVRLFGGLVTLALVPMLRVENPHWVYGAILFALLYNAVFLWVLIPRAPGWLEGGYLGYALDVVAISAVIAANGGIDSEFFAIYFLTVVIFLFRFPHQHLFFVPACIGVSYAWAVGIANGFNPETIGLMSFRLTWIAAASLFTTLTVERGRRAEGALTLELRRTSALLEAAHAPAASLTVDGVLNAVALQATRLTESEAAVVIVSEPPGDLISTQVWPANAPLARALQRLLLSERALTESLVAAERPMGPGELADGLDLPDALRSCRSISAVRVPGHEGSIGIVAVARIGGPHMADVHYEALSAFVERAALAIQNARLYERLQEQVDEIRAMHEQIVRTERLAAIGEIAAKVAHELNNPLTSIHLYNSMLIEEPVEGEEQQRLAAAMLEQVERAKRVVRDILDFSRPQESHPQVASLNETVEYGLRLIQHAAQASRVTILVDYAGNLPEVLVDQALMAQIFTNLATNAIQAMPEGGKLIVRTGMQGEELFVSFTDTGQGISAANQERIFEPFFTTKPAGQGTGLGLSVVKGLVSRHHGRITVDSEPGKGATFTVWLPPAMNPQKEGAVARPQHR